MPLYFFLSHLDFELLKGPYIKAFGNNQKYWLVIHTLENEKLPHLTQTSTVWNQIKFYKLQWWERERGGETSFTEEKKKEGSFLKLLLIERVQSRVSPKSIHHQCSHVRWHIQWGTWQKWGLWFVSLFTACFSCKTFLPPLFSHPSVSPLQNYLPYLPFYAIFFCLFFFFFSFISAHPFTVVTMIHFKTTYFSTLLQNSTNTFHSASLFPLTFFFFLSFFVVLIKTKFPLTFPIKSLMVSFILIYQYTLM